MPGSSRASAPDGRTAPRPGASDGPVGEPTPLPPLAAFAQQYRGRRLPEDALWWLHHPADRGPSGAPPPQELFLAAIDELEAAGMPLVARSMTEMAHLLLARDQAAARAALRLSGGDDRRRGTPG